jgi:hypothetical protein
VRIFAMVNASEPPRRKRFNMADHQPEIFGVPYVSSYLTLPLRTLLDAQKARMMPLPDEDRLDPLMLDPPEDLKQG